MLSLLRWPGGKTRASKMICEFLPYQPQTLCSPFFGGGSVEFLLASKGWKINAYDGFHSLVNFWNFVKKHQHEMSIVLRKYLPLTKQEFYSLQERLIALDVDKVSSLEAAVAFYVLNRASFSGSTLSGGMSPGHPRFTLSCIENLKNFRGMDNINIKCMDFRESIKENPNDWLYLDPPYALENNKNNLYGIKGNMHKFFPHEDLFALLKNRDKWLLSYNDSEYIRDMYKDYKIFPLHYAYGMSKDKKSKEILIRSRS